MDLLDTSVDGGDDHKPEVVLSTDPTEIVVDKEVIATHSMAIVEEDGSLGSATGAELEGEEVHAQELIDPSSGMQYQIRQEGTQGGTVTYRVVQVTQGGDAVETIPQIATASTSGFSTAQAVLTSPLNGQFYVIGSTQEVFGATSPRTLAPRTGQLLETTRGSSSRDERRRATHNEVERRRRDKINNWIVRLGKIIPDCGQETAKQNQVSKGGILAKACEYIADLRNKNEQLTELLKEQNLCTVSELKQQLAELKSENTALRMELQNHGIHISDENMITS